MRLKDSSAGGSVVFLTMFSVLSQLLGFLYRVCLSRMVGAQVMGLYQLVMPVYSVLMSITAIGLTAAVSNFTSRYLALDNVRAVRQTVRSCMILLGCLMIPVAAVTAALYDPISVYLLGDARTQMGLLLLLPCVALTGVENLHKHFFYGSGQVRTPAVVELLEQVIRAGAVLGLLALFLPQNPERTVGLIVVGMILCEIFSSVTLVTFYRCRLGRMGDGGAGEQPRRLYRRVAAIALPVGATALLGNLMGAVNAALIPQRLVAGGVRLEQAMSDFGVLCGMTMPMLSLPTVFLGALNLIMVPRVAGNCALGRTDRANWEVLRTLEMVSLIILPCMALMTVVGSDLGVLLFGESKAGQYIVPLGVATACSCFQAVLSGGLNAANHQGTAALIALICDVVQLVLTALLMGRPGGGMGGFVIGVVVSSVLGLALCGLAIRRHTGLRVKLCRMLALPGLATLLSWQLALLLHNGLRQAQAPQTVQVGSVLAFGAVVYLSALCAMGAGQNGFFPRTGKNCVDKSKQGRYNS